MRSRLLLAALLLSYPCQAAQLSLPVAIQTTLESKPAIMASRQIINQSVYDQKRIAGQLLPQLSVSHSSNYTKALTIDQTTHAITLSGSQIIFSPAGPNIQSSLAEIATTRATYQYAAATHEARLSATTAFLHTWLLQAKRPVIDALEEYTLLFEARIQEQWRLGSLSPAALALQQATIAQNKASIATYPLQLASLKEDLAQKVGSGHVALNAAVALVYNAKHPLPQLQDCNVYLTLARANRPEYKDKEAAREQQTIQARANRLSYVPTIALHGSVGTAYAGASTYTGATGNLGITLQWNMFDGMQALNAAHAAEASALRVTLEAQELKNTIEATLAHDYNLIKTNELLLQAAHARKAASKAYLVESRALHQQGALDSLTLAKQEYDYKTAKHEYLSQRIALHTTWHSLARQCGYPSSGEFNEL